MIRRFFLFFVFLFLAACGGEPPYDGVYQMNLAKGAAEYKEFTHIVDGQAVYGVKTGDTCKPAVLFIHGAPGDWRAWGRYLGDDALLDHVSMIAIDRPGYGGSSIKGGLSASLVDQSSMIMQAVLREHKGPFLVVGHSYGGPVQVRMAVDYPDHISSLLMLAGAIDPSLHKPRFYHRLASMWFIGALLSEPLRVANKEMMFLNTYLTEQLIGSDKISIPTTVIQGNKDWLVPVKNAEFVKKTFVKSKVNIVSLDNQGHFIPWDRYDLVRQEILGMAKKMADSCGDKKP